MGKKRGENNMCTGWWLMLNNGECGCWERVGDKRDDDGEVYRMVISTLI